MTRHLMGIVILAVATLTACEREGSPPTSAEVDRAAAKSVDRAAVDTKAAADAKIAANLKAAAAAKAAADQAAADTQAATDAKIAADLQAAAEKAAADQAAADANIDEATSLLTQFTEYIEDNKTEQAEETLSQLDEMKGSLPASLQEKIESARTALNAKKATAALVQ